MVGATSLSWLISTCKLNMQQCEIPRKESSSIGTTFTGQLYTRYSTPTAKDMKR